MDPDDQMAVDSYFFASFANSERTIRSIRRLIDARPANQLPRMSSEQSDQIIAGAEEDEEQARQRKKHSHKGVLGGLKKVLKPLVGGHSHKDKEKDTDSHASSETLHPGLEQHLVQETDDGYDGYPPRQSGVPPADKDDKSWSEWLKKPVVKVLHSKPSHNNDLDRVSSSRSSTFHPIRSSKTRRTSRPGPGEPERVTEVVEPVVADSDDDEASSDDDRYHGRHRRRASRKERESFNSDMSDGSGLERSNYAVVDGSKEGNHEEGEIVRKFRSVFSLSEKEELIDRKFAFLLARLQGAELTVRLPRLLVPGTSCIWPILRFDQLLLFPLLPATVQDQGQLIRPRALHRTQS